MLPRIINNLLRVRPRYDSRCYSINYHAEFKQLRSVWTSYKTDYFIELPNNTDMRKLFKQQGYITPIQMADILKQWQKDKQGYLNTTP
jgi:hypothetical protein